MHDVIWTNDGRDKQNKFLYSLEMASADNIMQVYYACIWRCDHDDDHGIFCAVCVEHSDSI